MFNKSPPPPKACRLWDNVEKCSGAGQATDDNILKRMRIACWITKATNTPSEYVTLIASPRQKCYANAPEYHATCIMPVLLNHWSC
jgi:hypothetical protein